MIVSALAMLFLVVFGFGQFVRRPEKADLFLYVATSMVFSFYLAWFVFFVSYNTGLGEHLPWLSIIAAVAASALLVWRISHGVITGPRLSHENGGWIFVLAGVGASVALALQIEPAIGMTFIAWDALNSWNRWAMELAQNSYNPMNTAYPVFLPAAWSLIYEAQGSTELWYFSRASTAFVAILCLAVMLHIGAKRGVVLFSLVFAAGYFAFFSKDALYSGYMDQPSAVFALAAILLTAEALAAPRQNRLQLFLPAVLLVSMSVLTKQHGVFAAAVVCAAVAFQFFSGALSFRRAATLAVLFLAPIASYLVIYLAEQETLWGNLSQLNQVSANATGANIAWRTALQTLWAELPSALWGAIIAGVLLNLVFFRDPRAWMAGLLVAGVLPGFMIYADCCSYSERNGMWILGNLIGAAYAGYSMASEALRARGKQWPAAVAYGLTRLETKPFPSAPVVAGATAIGIAIASALFVNGRDFDRMYETQRHQQVYLMEPPVQRILETYPDVLEGAEQFFTPANRLKWHPWLEEKYQYCRGASRSCFDRAQAGDLYLTAPWFESDSSEALINEALTSGELVLLHEAGPRRLFVFRPTSAS